MAGERTTPGPLAIVSFWDAGSPYKAQMDENLRKIGIFTQGVVDSQEASAPGSPSDGDVHIATADWAVALEGGASSNSAGDMLVRDNGAWKAYTPWAGLNLWQADIGVRIEWSGSAWVAVQTGLFKGYYANLAALESAHASPDDGSFAYVDAGVGEDPEFYVWDTDDDEWKLAGGAGGGVSASAYDIRSGFGSEPASSATIDRILVPREVSFAADFAGSLGLVQTNPGSDYVISVKDDDVEIGTVTISDTGVFTFATVDNTAKVVEVGSALTIEAPGSVDGTIIDVDITLVGEV